MLTSQQTTILEAITASISTQGVAGPGCGKTFLLEKCIEQHLKEPGIVLAFESAIAKELASRIPEGARWLARTTHQWGKSVIHKSRIDPNGAKLKAKAEPRCQGAIRKYQSSIISLTSTLREYAYGFPEGVVDEQIPAILQDLDLAVPSELHENIIPIAIRLVHDCDEDTSIIDFTDMLRQPLLQDAKFPSYKFILADEVQDWSVLQRLLLRRALATNAATVFVVGDPKQAIYAFRGADADAFENICSEFNLTQFPLNCTWRCPPVICDEANKIYPNSLIPMADLPGSVTNVEYSTWLKSIEAIPEDSATVCRINAPLFKIATALLRTGRKFRMKPRFGNSLIMLIHSMTPSTIDDLVHKIDVKRTALLQDAPSTAAERLLDKYESILVCCEGEFTVKALCEKIRTLTQGATGPYLSTIHGVKGLEYDTVFFLRPDLCPHPLAKTQSELVQEQNLRFVAITRAKRSLVYLTK